MRFPAALVAALVLVVTSPASAHGHSKLQFSAAGLANTTVLIIRHAEEAESGSGLSPAGELRAQEYARYFRSFMLGEQSLRVDTLVAAADTRASHRPRLTLEPLSRVTGMPIQQPFHDRDVRDLANWLGQGLPGRTILISWRHGRLPMLMNELGLNPTKVLRRGRWPSQVYDWVVVLRFDRDGAVIPAFCGLIREPTPPH